MIETKAAAVSIQNEDLVEIEPRNASQVELGP